MEREQIIDLVLARYELTREQLFSPTRGKAYVSQARQIAMYILHCTLQLSYDDISEYFSRHRAAIMHGVSKIEDLRDEEHPDGVHKLHLDKWLDMVDAHIRFGEPIDGP